MIYQGQKRYPVREVMLHCAAIRTGQFHNWTPYRIFMEVNKWHKSRSPAFKSFGYHGLITEQGEFFAGRPFAAIGAGCAGKNQGVIHLLMIERKLITHISDHAETWFTAATIAATQEVIAALPKIAIVSGHNNYANKLCPGFKVLSSDWLGTPRKVRFGILAAV